MNWLDIAIIAITGFGFVKGLFDGIVKQVVSLIALLAAVYFSSKVAIPIESYMERFEFISPMLIAPLSYILAFSIILTVLGFIGSAIHKAISITPLGFFNHIFGGFLGALISVLGLSLLFNLMGSLHLSDVLFSKNTIADSELFKGISQILQLLFPHLNFYELIKDKLEELPRVLAV